jgi:peptide/nickel transport system substrate-binding protein
MRRPGRVVVGAAALAVAVGTLLPGAATAQDATPTATPDEHLRFVVGLTNNMVTVNPLRALESPEYELLSLQYDLLFNFSAETMAPEPTGLATEIPTKENGGISEDGLTYTIPIRTGVTWSDGQPLTAHDIAFTYNFIIDNNFSLFTGYFPFTDEISAPDETTLVWTTKRPSIAPLLPPWVYILPEHVWSGMTKEEARKFENFPDPVTSGAFRLTEWQKDEFWTVAANKGYYGGSPTLDEVVFKYYTNVETMAQDLKSGEIDFAEGLTVELFRDLQDEPGVETVVGSATGFTQFSMNMCNADDPDASDYCKKNPGTGHPALRDPVVREAIAMAIDKQGLVERVLGGYGTPGTTIVPPAFAFWHLEPTEQIPFDIAGANALLDGAGYVDSDGDGVRNMPGGGEDLNFRFILRSEDTDSPKYGRLIAGWLDQIGIKTETVSVTDGKLINAWYDHDFDLYVWGWGPDPDPDFILSTFTAGQCGVWSDTCFSDAEYNQLYEEQRSPESPEQRKEIVDRMQQIIYEQIPEIVLYYGNDLQAYRSDRWEGFVFQPTPAADGTGGSILFQYGNYSYLSIKPAAAEEPGGGPPTTGGGGGGIPVGVWIAIIAAVVVVIGGIVVARSRGSEEDRA